MARNGTRHKWCFNFIKRHALDCTNTLLRSETNHQEIIGVGLKNIIAIVLPDAVLIAQKNNANILKILFII